MGYTWPGMKKLSKQQAVELFDTSWIFLLYNDESETEAKTIEDVKQHKGEYGIPKGTISNSPFFRKKLNL